MFHFSVKFLHLPKFRATVNQEYVMLLNGLKGSIAVRASSDSSEERFGTIKEFNREGDIKLLQAQKKISGHLK